MSLKTVLSTAQSRLLGCHLYTQYSCTTSKQRLFRAICKSNEGENEVFSSLVRFLTLSTFMWNQTQSQICSRNLLTKSELFQHLLNKAIVGIRFFPHTGTVQPHVWSAWVYGAMPNMCCRRPPCELLWVYAFIASPIPGHYVQRCKYDIYKTGIHNVSQRRRRRIELLSWVTHTQTDNWWRSGLYFWRYACRQTETNRPAHTEREIDTLIKILGLGRSKKTIE